MKYPQVTEWSLQRYRESLQERRSSVGAESQEAIDRLIKTIDAALDHPAELRPDEVGFGVTSLGKVPPHELPAFINQYTLGVGWDGAPVVVMGTEPAESPESAEDMAWHAVYSVLVATDSRPEVLDRIVDGSSWQASKKGGWNSIDKRPYHLQANDFIHVERGGGTPTWKVIAQVVAPESADGWRDLLETRLGAAGLGGPRPSKFHRGSPPGHQTRDHHRPTFEWPSSPRRCKSCGGALASCCCTALAVAADGRSGGHKISA